MIMEENKKLQTRPLETIESEINFYKQQTAIGIIEIGKRLIEAKEQVNHGEWGTWLKDRVEFSQWTANKFMKCTTEFSNCGLNNNLGQTKIFALLDLPIDERDLFISEQHEVNGEIKTVDEMTSMELKKVIKEKKELENKIYEKENETEQLKQELKIEKNKPKDKEYVETVVDNTDYTVVNKLKKIEQELKDKQTESDRFKTRLELMTDKADAYKQDSEDYQKMKEDITYLTKQKDDLGRQIQAITNISGLVVEIDHLIKEKLAPIRYSKSLLEAKDDEIVLRNLTDIVQVVQQWCDEIKEYMPNKINYVEVIE
jgi:hypothetical protein